MGKHQNLRLPRKFLQRPKDVRCALIIRRDKHVVQHQLHHPIGLALYLQRCQAKRQVQLVARTFAQTRDTTGPTERVLPRGLPTAREYAAPHA